MVFIKQHFQEFKKLLVFFLINLFWLFFCCSINFYTLILLLSSPFIHFEFVLYDSKDFVCTNLYETFFAYLFVTIFFSLYFSFLFLISIIFKYVKSGLFKFEIRILDKFIKTFILNIVLSNIFTYFIILPATISIFFSLMNNLNTLTIQMQVKIFSYIEIVVVLIIIFNLLFQFPLLLLFCQYFFNISLIYKNRRMLTVFYFLFGCIFSTPDVIVQLFVALLIFVYVELFVFFLFLKQQYIKCYRELLEW